MTFTTRALLLGAALALAACSNASRFGDGAGGTGLSDTATRTDTAIIPGSVNDPGSPAYFNQAIGDRVFFEVDQSVLTPAAQSTLDAQAQWLLTNADYNAMIEGHADEQGTRDYNIALGARRANAVMEYLVSRGVAQSRMRYISYGKERPVEICSAEACYAKNRRSVTIISQGLTG